MVLKGLEYGGRERKQEERKHVEGEKVVEIGKVEGCLMWKENQAGWR